MNPMDHEARSRYGFALPPLPPPGSDSAQAAPGGLGGLGLAGLGGGRRPLKPNGEGGGVMVADSTSTSISPVRRSTPAGATLATRRTLCRHMWH
jgi:hypothetical protein